MWIEFLSLHLTVWNFPIDRIEHDVIVQIFALQDGVYCERVHVGVRACAVEVKPGMLRAACFFDVRV